MHRTHKKLWLALAAAALLLLGGSYFVGAQIVEASTRLVTNEQTMEAYRGSWELEGFDYERFLDRYEIETLTRTSSFDGHTLPFDVITSDGGEVVVIMVHGMMGNRLTNYPTAEIFLENGCHVISYDQRSSGENFAERSTFGYWEKYDLMDCVAYARERWPEARLVVWGESFGGAAALLGAACEEVQKELSALILDCPVSSMADMLEAELKNMGIPLPMGYLMACGNAVNQLKLGFSYGDADGTAAAEKITVPTLIFNSMADEITPVSMGRDVYSHLASEKKELWTSRTSAHIEIRNHERDIYEEKLLEYIAESPAA